MDSIHIAACREVSELQAWEHAPLETLQLVAHLRDVREGKGEKERGWDAYIWLAQKHPRTLLVNLPEVVKVLSTTTNSCLILLCTSICDALHTFYVAIEPQYVPL